MDAHNSAGRLPTGGLPPANNVSSKQMAHHNVVESLLSAIGPDTALHWVAATASGRPNTHISPAIFRALIARALRAGATNEVDSAVSALKLAAKLPVQCAGSPLGFAGQKADHERASVVQELLHALAAGEPLAPDDPALSFYDNAGHGCGDASEFHAVNPDADGRPAHVTIKRPLEQVRLYGLVQVVQYMTCVVSMEGKLGDLMTYLCGGNAVDLFLSPFVNDLPRNVDRLQSDSVSTLQRFYGVALSAVNAHVRDTAVSRVANSVMSLAHDRAENVLRFLSTMQDHRLLLDTCRLCLMQRFGVKDKLERALTVKALSERYLALTITQRKINSILPALYIGLLTAWVKVADVTSDPPDEREATECCQWASVMLNSLCAGKHGQQPSINERSALQVAFGNFMQWLVSVTKMTSDII